jgi:hypothetical protein
MEKIAERKGLSYTSLLRMWIKGHLNKEERLRQDARVRWARELHFKVLMSEIGFGFSSSPLMWSNNSSISPEQDEGITLILRFFLLNCEIVSEPASRLYDVVHPLHECPQNV